MRKVLGFWHNMLRKRASRAKLIFWLFIGLFLFAACIPQNPLQKLNLKGSELELSTPLPTETPTLEPSATPTNTVQPTNTPEPTNTTAPSNTPEPTKTKPATPSKTPTKTASPTPTSTATSEPAGCPYGCTEEKPGCNIKGNISSKSGEKIYHMPYQRYYDQTVINPDYGERWFCTEEEAVANGWRKSKQ